MYFQTQRKASSPATSSGSLDGHIKLCEIATWNAELQKAVLTTLTNGAPQMDIAENIEVPEGSTDDDKVVGVFNGRRVPISNLTCAQHLAIEGVAKESKAIRTGRIEAMTMTVEGETVDVWISKRMIKGDEFLVLMEGEKPGKQLAQLRVDTCYNAALSVMKQTMAEYTSGKLNKVEIKLRKDQLAEQFKKNERCQAGHRHHRGPAQKQEHHVRRTTRHRGGFIAAAVSGQGVSGQGISGQGPRPGASGQGAAPCTDANRALDRRERVDEQHAGRHRRV